MKSICIEILYPEMSDLYGDNGNILYLKKKLELMGCSVETIYTKLEDVPAFTWKKVDFLYLGPCTENQQKLQAERLQRYRAEIEKRMNSNDVTLFTGNAFELLGEYIVEDKGRKFSCLGLLPFYAKRFYRLRYNDLSVGLYGKISIVGYKNQLSHSYTTSEKPFSDCFLRMEKGSGINPESSQEGFCKNHFYATYLLGPILPLNPVFSDRIIQHMTDMTPVELPFEKDAYNRRLTEYRK